MTPDHKSSKAPQPKPRGGMELLAVSSPCTVTIMGKQGGYEIMLTITRAGAPVYLLVAGDVDGDKVQIRAITHEDGARFISRLTDDEWAAAEGRLYDEARSAPIAYDDYAAGLL
jgi:hypothetical protein